MDEHLDHSDLSGPMTKREEELQKLYLACQDLKRELCKEREMVYRILNANVQDYVKVTRIRKVLEGD